MSCLARFGLAACLVLFAQQARAIRQPAQCLRDIDKSHNASVDIHSVVYNVEWSNKIANPDGVHVSTQNAASFVLEQMKAGADFITIPECTGPLVVEVLERSRVKHPYDVLMQQRGNTGLGFFWNTDRFRLADVSHCTIYKPGTTDLLTELSDEGKWPGPGANRLATLLRICKGKPETIQVPVPKDDDVVGATSAKGLDEPFGSSEGKRPLITARFELREKGSSEITGLVVSSIHSGHFTHDDDAKVVIASIRAVLPEESADSHVVLVQGDMNTHFGINTGEAKERVQRKLLDLLPVGGHGYGAPPDKMTYSLPSLNELVKTISKSYSLYDSNDDTSDPPRDLVSCCCPPWTPTDGEGTGCAGAASMVGEPIGEWKVAFTTASGPEGSCPALPQRSTLIGIKGITVPEKFHEYTKDKSEGGLGADFAAGSLRELATTAEDVNALWNKLADPNNHLIIQGEDTARGVPVVVHKCLASTGIIGIRAAAREDAELRAFLRPENFTLPAVGNGEARTVEFDTLAQYAFDHVFVGYNSIAYRHETTLYKLAQPKGPSSDHFPLLVEMTIAPKCRDRDGADGRCTCLTVSHLLLVCFIISTHSIRSGPS